MEDARLPYLLRKENISRLEGKALLIGDRRVFPFERSFVRCTTIGEVASAIRGMVTQGGGPLQVALTAMRWVALQSEGAPGLASLAPYAEAARMLSQARPTNTTMKRTLQGIITRMDRHLVRHPDETPVGLASFVNRMVDGIEEAFDAKYASMSDFGASMIADGRGIITTCFAEHSFLLSVAKARDAGKRVCVYVPETRPYLQGSRLTAPSLQEMGVDVVVVTDGMGAHLMQDGSVGLYMTAADLVAMDGTVVNKTGTLANAVCARYFGIPYVVFALSPDPLQPTVAVDMVEERSGFDVLVCRGVPTTSTGMAGRYPAFDVVPPSLVRSIVTPQGVFAPSAIGTDWLACEGTADGDEEI
jgi:methylthioribose-1-phosphate isomerase